MRAAQLDAVTLDAHGTLVRLADPVPALQSVLAERGVERTPEVVLAGFRTEVAHYAPRAGDGYDEPSLQRLQEECAGIFLAAIGAQLDPVEFAPAYVGALRFEVLPGVPESLARLRALGLELAVVANWDLSLRRLLDEVGLARHFTVGSRTQQGNTLLIGQFATNGREIDECTQQHAPRRFAPE